MRSTFFKFLLILSIYLGSQTPEAFCQSRFKNYIVSLSDASKQEIFKNISLSDTAANAKKSVLLKKHLLKLGLIPVRAVSLEETYVVKLVSKKNFTLKNSKFKKYFTYIEPDYNSNPDMTIGAYDLESEVEDFSRLQSKSHSEFATAQAVVVNDPELSNAQSWGLDQFYGGNITDAWGYTTGNATEVVAVLGTGIDLAHQDLIPNLWKDTAPSSSNKKESASGFNVFNSSTANPPQDDHGISTFAAGIIGARGGNAIGIAGVTWNAKLMPVKVLNASASGSVSQVVEGIDYIIRKKQAGANVIAIHNFANFSADTSNTLRNKIQEAGNAGILFITAAGDAGRNLETQAVIPANLNLPNMITVASYYGQINYTKPPHFSDIYFSNSVAPYSYFSSNYGSTRSHLVAPGERVRSSWKGNTYTNYSGTSISAAYVTGAVALMKSYSPSMTMPQIKDQILNNVRRYETVLNGKVSTQGALDLYLAMSKIVVQKAGDCTGDGVSDGSDFLFWQRNFGKTGSNLPCDLDNNGVIDGADLTIWRNSFGK